MDPLGDVVLAGPRAPPAPVTDEQARDALRMPVDLGTPFAYALGRAPFLILVNDHHRPTPTPRLLDWLDAHLRSIGAAGVVERGCTVLVAAGAHAAPSDADLRGILAHWAEPLMSRGLVRVHDATAPDLISAGRTRRGTPLQANPALTEFPVAVSLNSVEPHYFAGYTGARKSVFPGIASLAATEANHRLALEDGVAPRALDGNPVAEDLAEGTVRILRATGARAFAFNAVSVGEDVYALASGTLEGVLNRLAPVADHVFGAPVDTAFDIVVARPRPPYSRALYRCMKAFEHGRLAVKPGGALVLDAPCEEGLGPFVGVDLVSEHGSRDAVVRAARDQYVLGAHQPARLFQWLADGHRAYFATPGLAEEDVRTLGATPVASWEAGVEAAARDLGLEKPRVLVLDDATNVVPVTDAM